MKPYWFIGAALVLLSLAVSPSFGAEIHDAARRGDMEAVVRLLDQGVALEAPDSAGQSPLLVASLAGRADVVALLIKRGADVGAPNDRGLTALHATAYVGNIEAVQILIKAGANVNNAENKFKVTPLIVAAEEDHADVVKFLIEHGADVEWKERAGYTALSRAVFRKHWETVAVLLKGGAKCQDEDKIGSWSVECSKRVDGVPQ